MMTQSINQSNPSQELPANILLEKWADIGFSWSGEVAVESFERLSKNLILQEQNQQVKNLNLKVNLQKIDGTLWLNYEVVGKLITPCQRCLEPTTVDVTGDYRLAILFNESQADQVQDAEYVLVDELNPSDSRKMLPIKDLLEDELLLVLPLSPRHDDCEMPIEMVEDEEEAADNPFAALAALKGQLN